MSRTVSYLKSGFLLLGKDGTYKIEGVLGVGTFSIVYQASVFSEGESGRGVPVAVKELFIADINSRDNDVVITSACFHEEMENRVSQFKEEAKNLSSLDIEGVVKAIEVIETNGTYYLVMEMVDGISLEKFVNTNRVSDRQALHIIKGLSRSVSILHDKAGLLHLDIKPSNIILTRSDLFPVLLDFGLSCHAGTACEDFQGLSHRGTPGFASYEQSHYGVGDRMTEAMDIYALGATLYKIVTGYTPPSADELKESPSLLEISLSKNGVSRRIADIILRSMGLIPSDRFQTVGELLTQLDDVKRELVGSDKNTGLNSIFGKTHWHDVDVIYFSMPVDEPSGRRHLQEWVISKSEIIMTIDHIQHKSRHGILTEEKWHEILDFVSALNIPQVTRGESVSCPYRLELNLVTGETFMIPFGDNSYDKSLYIGLISLFNTIHTWNQGSSAHKEFKSHKYNRSRLFLLAISVILMICSSYFGFRPLHVPALGEHIAILCGIILAVVWFLASQYWESNARKTMCRSFFYISAAVGIILSLSVFLLQRPMALPTWTLASCFTLITALSVQLGESD